MPGIKCQILAVLRLIPRIEGSSLRKTSVATWIGRLASSRHLTVARSRGIRMFVGLELDKKSELCLAGL